MNELELLRRIQDLERRASRQDAHSHGSGGGATDGWLAIAATWTRTANTTFTAVGNVTALFPVGTKIKVTDTTTKYFYVVSAVYSAVTTVTITGGTDFSLAANPSARWISYADTPQGFPQWFNWSPTWGGFSSPPGISDAVFSLAGRQAVVIVNCSGNGTSNATTLTITNIPFTPAYNARGVLGYAVDNNTPLTVAGRIYISNTGTTLTAYTDMNTGAWTNENGKRADFCITFGV